MEKVRYMISDAAALAGVETHVLRYWEEELDLTIPRNEMGHRYYTRENIQEFQKIKELKEKGYQLKAIRMILHGEGEPLPPDAAAQTSPQTASQGAQQTMAQAMQQRVPQASPQTAQQAMARAVPQGNPHVQPLVSNPEPPHTQPPVNTLSAEERMAQFRELMSDIVGHAISQNNEALTLDISKEIRETVLKEMNYLIREQTDMTEEHYRQLSAEIRGKLQKKHGLFSKKEKAPKVKPAKKEKARKKILNPVG